MFDPVTVQLTLDRSNIQHEKLVFKLVKPFIPNFSVSSIDEESKENVTRVEENVSEECGDKAGTSRNPVVLQQMKRKDEDFRSKDSSRKKKHKKWMPF